MAFDYASRFRADLPAPAIPWTGFPAYNFVGGHNDAEAVPVDAFIAASRDVLTRDGHTLATYGLASGPQGYRPLREFLAQSLNARAGINDTADNILVVSGSLQALDLVNDVFLEPGDTVLVEEASYQGTLQRFDRLGVRHIGVPLDGDGIQPHALEVILQDLQDQGTAPKYLYTIPTVQNPTGSVMPEGRRQDILALAQRFGVPIFEDDCYADLTFDGVRPKAFRGLDTEGQVIYCGSFSKTIAPALRVGYLAADWEVLSRLISAKHDAGSGALEQMMLAEYCTAHFDAHVSQMQDVLGAKCATIVDALAAEFGTAAEYVPPKGGIFIWVTLPDAVDTTRLAEVALGEGVALNPGSDWSSDPASGRHRMRLCFGHPTHEDIRAGIARLAEICHREFGVPVRSANTER
jgi:2-aminoadipate transaminase